MLAIRAAGAAIAASSLGTGRIRPSAHLTGNGRLLQPPGRFVRLGHFPTGGALTPVGRFYWTVSTGQALNDVRIIAVGGRQPRVIQTLPTPGRGGDVIHVFVYSRQSGRAHETSTIAVPPPGSAAVPQSFPPKKSGHTSWPDRLAVSPNGRSAT